MHSSGRICFSSSNLRAKRKAVVVVGTGLLWLSSFSSFALTQDLATGPNPTVPGHIPPASSALASQTVSSKTTGTKSSGKHLTKPLWSELTPPQQEALAPLFTKWDSVSEPQKRKWLVLSRNFPKMSGAEQAKLHSRMSEWAALSPQQRTQARLNFGQTQQLSPDDKKAKWEAYQALPPEEKRKLAARATKPPQTAAAVKPVPAERLAAIPRPKLKQINRSPRIAAAPRQADINSVQPEPKSMPASGLAN